MLRTQGKYVISEEIKRVSILRYGFTINTQTKWKVKDGRKEHKNAAWCNNNSCKQPHTKKQLYDNVLPISQTIRLIKISHAEHGWRRKCKLLSYALKKSHSCNCQYWPTSKDLHTLTLGGRSMLSRRPTRSDEW